MYSSPLVEISAKLSDSHTAIAEHLAILADKAIDRGMPDVAISAIESIKSMTSVSNVSISNCHIGEKVVNQ